MSDKCPKCGAEVRWASRDSVEFACGVTQSTPKHPKINIVQTHGCYERQLAQSREDMRTESIRAADAETGLRTCRAELLARQGELRAKSEAISQLEILLAQAKEREAALQKLISAQDEQLLLVDRERDTEKSRADKLQEKLDRLYDSGLDGPQLIDDSQAFGDRVDEFRQDQSQPLTLIEQRELAQWWAERGTLVSDLDDRCCTEMARADKAEAELAQARGDPVFLQMEVDDLRADVKRLEKDAEDARGYARDMEEAAKEAEADLKTNAGLLAHQTDLAREAEIGKVKAERLQRLREAAWPVADQVAEVVVMGADGSRCRLVPVGLLLTLREALRTRLGEAAQGEEASDGEA